MPWILGLLRGLWVVAKPLLMHILIAIGVGMVTYNGVGALFDVALQAVQDQFVGLPEQTRQLLAVTNCDKAISVLFSAITTRLTLQGMTAAGALKKVYWTGGAPIVLN